MKVYKEVSLRDFGFWAGAVDHVEYLTGEEMDTIEELLEGEYPEGMSETDVNDLFWFDEDTIAAWLGYADFEELTEREDEDEDGREGE